MVKFLESRQKSWWQRGRVRRVSGLATCWQGWLVDLVMFFGAVVVRVVYDNDAAVWLPSICGLFVFWMLLRSWKGAD
jgi:hypothetical protein